MKITPYRLASDIWILGLPTLFLVGVVAYFIGWYGLIFLAIPLWMAIGLRLQHLAERQEAQQRHSQRASE